MINYWEFNIFIIFVNNNYIYVLFNIRKFKIDKKDGNIDILININ